MRKLITILSLIFTLLSCKAKYIIQENYEKEDKIILSHYFLKDCETPLYMRYCNNGIADSLFNLFAAEIGKYKLPIEIVDSVKNKMDVKVWKKEKNYLYYHFNRIDTSYIVNSTPDSIGTFLIPVIDYTDIYYHSINGVSYKIRVDIAVFLIKNKRIIYSMNGWQVSNSFFYVTPEELDMSKMNIRKMWADAVEKALQPYIDRLN
jgi:hypothetical protein